MMRAALLFAALLYAGACCLLGPGIAAGGESADTLHPDVRLLDADGRPVIETGEPVSAERSCGACHDTDYIDAHSYHVGAGHETLEQAGALPWDRGTGWLGGWDPISYRTLSRSETDRRDLDIDAWLRTKGARHPGGGFAAASGAGHDCFVCHLEGADIKARREALAAGRFRWATTATLSGTGLVERTEDGYRFDAKAMGPDGSVDVGRLVRIVEPTARHCGACHGPVHTGTEPLAPTALEGWNLETRGQIFSGQRLFASGLNLHRKSDLARPFDVHAERLLDCANCHHAPNRPGGEAQAPDSRPAHLSHDPRQLSIAEFLRTPNHALARGRDGSMRSCEGCHDVERTHTWLPHLERHVDALRCEACHIPEVHVPARRSTDWTVLTKDRGPRVVYRGTDGDARDPRFLMRAWQPVLLPREEPDGRIRLTPYNVMAVWYWLESEPERPVRSVDLESAFFDGDRYHADIVRAFDTDGDGEVAVNELRIDDQAKFDTVRARLETVGVIRPTLASALWPYALHHTVSTGRFSLRECTSCHAQSSRLGAPMDLGRPVFGAARPTWQGDPRVRPAGEIEEAGGRVHFRPSSGARYVVGYDRVAWIDVLGIVACALVIAGAGLHGLIRIWAARRGRTGR